MYKNNTSFAYTRDYNKDPKRSMSGLSTFDTAKLNAVQLLWPREMLYLYVVNNGEKPQEFFISYSGADRLIETGMMAMGFLFFALV